MSQSPMYAGDGLVRTVSFLDIMWAARRNRRLLALCTAVGLAVGVLLAFVLPSRYKAETRIVGQTSSRMSLASGLGGLGGIASQLGLPLEAATGTTTPQFYVDLMQSREMMETLLRTSFPVDGDSTRRAPLLDQLNFSGRTPALRMDKGVRYLRKRTSAVAAKSGIITISVTLPRADLAANVANRLVELVDTFNLERLHFQSRQQRIFTERRRREAEEELRNAEAQQLAFHERNRTITASPALQAEATRLQRLVQAKQEVFVMLSRSYEEARIAEAKDVPTITVIDRGEPPARRSFPLYWAFSLGGALAGLAAAAGILVVREMLERARAQSTSAPGAISQPSGSATRPVPAA